MEEIKTIDLTNEQITMLVDALEFKMSIFYECTKDGLPFGVKSEIPKLQTLLNYLKSL